MFLSSSDTLPSLRAARDEQDASGLSALAEQLAGVLSGGAQDVDVSSRRRAEYSTDASIYRVLPQAVVFPRTEEDVLGILGVARRMHVPVTMRGAGTSIAGNAVGEGIVVDTSRHFADILSIDPDERVAVVRPGVTIAQLQAAAAPFGLRFGPDPSTWTRCTIGGAIGNNACGPHALAYGKSGQQVVSLDVVDGRGRRFTAAEGLTEHPELRELVAGNLAIIRTQFGRFGRQVSGYALEGLLPERGEKLGEFLSGTEGTLGIILSATVRLQPIPSSPHLVVLGYPSMPDAADDVPSLLPFHPLALEGMDARLVDVVRRHRGAAAVPELPEGAGWLMIEVGGASEQEARAAASALVAASHALGSRVLPPGPDASALWRIRADGAGLGGRTPSGAQAWPGWEDAAVPPERLGEYLRAFDTLLKRYGLDGLPYGHLGDGCVHIRIDFPLEEGTDVMSSFLRDAARLVGTFGGSMSGEHGDGRARSALLPEMYTPEAIALFAAVKQIFDPENILNPGVIVDPAPLDQDVRRPFARPVQAVPGGFSFAEDSGSFTRAVHRCTGVGKCRADLHASGGFMCPSYQASRDEKDTTRARARVLEEMLRGSLVTAGWDAPEVSQALDLCLSCKACASDCPAGIDMARYKSEVLYRKFRHRLRPMSHYSLGWLPRWLRLARLAPRTTSWFLGTPVASALLHAFGGVARERSLPEITPVPFARWLRQTGRSPVTSPGEVRSRESSRGPVLVWSDSFSSGVDPRATRAVIAVLEDAGFDVVIPPEVCCGLTWITTGHLDGARRRLRSLVQVFQPFAAAGIPIVGIEPSCTAVLRSDLGELLPGDADAELVARSVVAFPELIDRISSDPERPWTVPDLAGTEFVVQPHCHQYAVGGVAAERRVLQRSGAHVTELAGCCGLAGNFGMERGHFEMSVKVAENALLPALRAHQDAQVLADGFSCRTQVAQLTDRHAEPLAVVLADARGLSY